MPTCENLPAARHAFPRNAPPVQDRRMTLDIQCREPAEYISSLKSTGGGTDRRGSKTQAFPMCENHTQVFQQIDRELMEDGWSAAFTAPPTRIL